MSETAPFPIQQGTWKYTDRDVREDPRLTELAIKYLQETGSTFDPIVRAQRILAEEGALPITAIRTVLNCMRQDFYLKIEMPIPERPLYAVPDDKPKVVIPMPKQSKCSRTDVHEPHAIDPKRWGDKNTCWGVKNDRSFYLRTPLKIKVGYIKGRQGMQMHAPHPNKDHHVERYCNQYGDGFVSYGGIMQRVVVHTVCRTPGRLTNPMLLTFEQALEIVGTAPLKIHPDKVITWCKTCFAEVFDE